MFHATSAWNISGRQLMVTLVAGIWLYSRSEKRRWAPEQAIPEIARLAGVEKRVAAFILAESGRLSTEPSASQIATAASELSRFVSLRSE
jgi:hypothetical protein